MKKLLVVVGTILLFVGVTGFLFSRWWRGRTTQLSLPVLSPTPFAQTTTLGTLLTHLRPLSSSEQTRELVSKTTDVSGLVRYTKSNSSVSFTVFALIPPGVVSDLHVWRLSADGEKDLGALREEKGGWLLDGALRPEELPLSIRIAPRIAGRPGRALLEGSIE